MWAEFAIEDMPREWRKTTGGGVRVWMQVLAGQDGGIRPTDDSGILVARARQAHEASTCADVRLGVRL